MLIKIDALKGFTNHTEKTLMLESPLNKTTSGQYRSFTKKRQQHQRPLVKPEKPPRTSLLTEHSDDGSLRRKAKYYFSLKVREQFSYSRAKTGGITLNL